MAQSVGKMFRNAKGAFERRFLIEIKEEPNAKNFDIINDVLEKSFKDGMEKNNFSFVHYSDFYDDLRQVIESDGKIFSASYGGKIVGTISMKKTSIDRWYHSGEAIILSMLGVLPKYQKCGLGKMLVDAVRSEAEKQGLPIILSTPEQNTSVISFYERNGFEKVQFYKSKMSSEHYTVRMFNKDGKTGTRSSYRRRIYENVALDCMMENWQMCDRQADNKIQKKWETEFLPYIKDESPEKCEDMRKCFQLYGISPKEYKELNFESIDNAMRSGYLSKRAVSSANRKFTKLFFGKVEKSTDDGTKDELRRKSITGADGYSEKIRIVTVAGNEEPAAAFALLYLKPNNGERDELFAAINAETGEISSKLLCIDNSEQKACDIELTADSVKEWQELIKLVKAAAEEFPRTIVGWDAVYTENGWAIEKRAKNPSFLHIQKAVGTGLRGKIEEILGQKITVKLTLK